MARQRVFVGIGEASLAERPEGDEPAGSALLVPIAAAMLGHRGVAISRLGQDPAADELVRRLRALGVEVDHLQSDPDLATARAASSMQRSRADDGTMVAWDNLQWDFDLADVAQVADAVIFSALGRRNGQARSTCDRFLAECTRAVRLHDLTRRPAGGLDRSRVLATLRSVEGAVVDGGAIALLLPGSDGDDPAAAPALLVRQAGLGFAIRCEPGAPVLVHTSQQLWTGSRAYASAQHEITIVGLLHGAIGGWSWPDAIALSERLAAHAAAHPHEKPPDELLRQR